MVYSLARHLSGFIMPLKAAAMRRLEDESGLAHRPLDMVADRLAAGQGDPLAEALWRAQEKRDREKLARLRMILPRLSLAAQDPRALRFLALLLLAAGFAVAGPEAGARLGKALAVQASPIAQSPPRIDAWIDPPPYTRLPPVFLSRGVPQPGPAGAAPEPVPAGSKLTLRVQGTKIQPRLRLTDIAAHRSRRSPLTRTAPEAFSGTVTLAGDAEITLKSALTTLIRYKISVARDQPPTIAFAEPVRSTLQKALRIGYRTRDDYGIEAVSLHMTRAQAAKGETQSFELPTPSGAGESVLHTNRDLTAHPWAGLDVQLSLVARDGAGQEGRSETVTVTLPERVFDNPLARALAEARRDMMRDPRFTGVAVHVINQVSDAIAGAEHDKALLLALRAASWGLADAAEHDEDGRTHVAELMWQVALALEDGAMGEAKMALQRARSALVQALENNAGDEEIARRMSELRAALARYLSAMQARQGQPAQGPINPALQAMTPQDFERMLETLEDLVRTGATGEAEKLLSALDDILQNLTPNSGQPGGVSETARDEALKALGELIGKQRALMDQTFRKMQEPEPLKKGDAPKGGSAKGELERASPSNGEPPKGEPAKKESATGQTPKSETPKSKASKGEPLKSEASKTDPAKDAAAQQEKLRRELGAAMTTLGERTGEIPRSLGRSERDMSDARDSLAQGQDGAALNKQKGALDAMREGAKDIAQARVHGEQGQVGDSPGPGGAPSTDPFGRPNGGLPDQGDSVRVPTAGEAQRARTILEEIRRRAAERGRPPEELDYLDRLLKRF
jgi:uncharacterized protein (TIGR02302 family)